MKLLWRVLRPRASVRVARGVRLGLGAGGLAVYGYRRLRRRRRRLRR